MGVQGWSGDQTFRHCKSIAYYIYVYAYTLDKSREETPEARCNKNADRMVMKTTSSIRLFRCRNIKVERHRWMHETSERQVSEARSR